MATSQGNETMPSVRLSSSQTSSPGSQTESAARCSAFRGHEKTAKARSQSEYIQVRNSLDFKYCARSSAVCVSKSAANTVGQTALATKLYRRNTAPYLHYLERKIKFLNSKVDSFNNDTEVKIKLINSKISSHVYHLDGEFQLVNNIKSALADTVTGIQFRKDNQDLYAYDIDMQIKLLQDSHADVIREIECINARRDSQIQSSEELIKLWKGMTYLDTHELNSKIRNEIFQRDYMNHTTNMEIEQLNAKKEAYADDLDNEMKMLNAKRLHGEDLDRQIELLCAKRDSSTRDLDRLIQQLNARIDSCDLGITRRLHLLNDKVATSTHDLGSQLELLTSIAAPFAHKLEGQLQLLDSKLTLCKQNVTNQQLQLNSNINSYFSDVEEKIRLFNIDLYKI